MNEFAVVLVLDIDGSPSVLPATDGLALNNDVALRPDNSERDDVLSTLNQRSSFQTQPDSPECSR